MTVRVGTPRLLARHLRTGLGGSVVVASLVLVLTIVTTIVSPAVTTLLDAATRYQLDRLSPPVRDLSTSVGALPSVGYGANTTDSLPPAYEATWGEWDTALSQIRRNAAPAIRESFGEADYFTRLGEPAQYASTTYVVLDPRYASRIRLVEGRLPEATATAEQWQTAFDDLIDPQTLRPRVDGTATLPVTEVVISAEAAQAEGWTIGDVREVGTEAKWPVPVPLVLVGTYDVVDAADPYWSRTTAMITPSRGADPDGNPWTRIGAFASPDGLVTIGTIAGGLSTPMWYPLDPETVTAEAAPDLLAELRGFTGTSQPFSTRAYPGANLSFQTGTISALETSTAQARTLVSVLAMFASGPFGVAVAVLALGCRLILERRRSALDLLAARGAAPAQLRGLLALEGMLVGVVPAVVGLAVGAAIARLAFPASEAIAPLAVVAAVALGLVPPAVVIASAGSTRAGRSDAPAHRSRLRGLVELLVALLAALATVLLLVRAAEPADDPGAVDPLLVIAPLLLSLVACVATLRLYPLALRGILARRQRGSGFVGVLGAARAIRDPATGVAPILALVVGVSFAVASGVLLSTVQVGAVQVARASVGADLLLSATRFDAGAEASVADIEGVAAVAPVSVAYAANLKTDDRLQRVLLFFADQALLDDVQQGYPAVIPPEVSLAGEGEPVPLLLSAAAAERADAANAELRIVEASAEYAGEVAGVVPFASNDQWALTDIASLPAVGEVTPVTVSMLVRLDEGADPDAVIAAVGAALGSSVQATTAARELAELADDPVVTGLRIALFAGIALSAVLAAVAVVLTLALGSSSRRRVSALLRTLGAAPRAAGGLVAWELVPQVVAALVVGCAFGAALPLLLTRVVDLTPFTGGADQPAYAVDAIVLAIALGGFLVVTAAVAVVAILITRRARIAAVLRTVEDS